MGVWEKMDDATLEMVKKQKAFEDETVKRLTPLYNTVKNPLVRMFLHRIILDTMKHSDTYQALIDLNTRAVVGEIDKQRMGETLATHITEESEMLNRAIELSQAVTDKNFRRIVEGIVEDERQHHALLKELFELLKKEGTAWNRYLYDITTDFP